MSFHLKSIHVFCNLNIHFDGSTTINDYIQLFFFKKANTYELPSFFFFKHIEESNLFVKKNYSFFTIKKYKYIYW